MRGAIVYSPWLAAASAAACGIALSIHGGTYYAALPVAYLTVYLGLLNPPALKFLKSGDYSYGIFLYGFVVQQMVVAFVPGARVWWLNCLISWPITVMLAMVSWHLVEKRVLRARKIIYTLEPHVLRAVPWLKSANRAGPGRAGVGA